MFSIYVDCYFPLISRYICQNVLPKQFIDPVCQPNLLARLASISWKYSIFLWKHSDFSSKKKSKSKMLTLRLHTTRVQKPLGNIMVATCICWCWTTTQQQLLTRQCGNISVFSFSITLHIPFPLNLNLYNDFFFFFWPFLFSWCSQTLCTKLFFFKLLEKCTSHIALSFPLRKKKSD